MNAQTSTLPTPDLIPAETLRTVVDGRWAHVRQQTREQLAANADMRANPDLSSADYRGHITDSLKFLTSSGRPHTGFDPSVGGEGDVGGVVTAFAMLAYGDLSLLVKAGVQWGLFGGAVRYSAPSATTSSTFARSSTASCSAASR